MQFDIFNGICEGIILQSTSLLNANLIITESSQSR